MAAKRRKPRVRRTPDEARTHILDAADAVFRDHLPDAVGLREIANAAGVSHGLVTHYFETYDGLVAAVLSRRLDAARAAAFAHLAQMTFAADEAPLLSVLIDLLEDRTLVRLAVWSLLTSGPTDNGFFVNLANSECAQPIHLLRHAWETGVDYALLAPQDRRAPPAR